jgi:protein-tyrosine phosphatase
MDAKIRTSCSHMIPLVDLHCHLLAGLDDGPASLDEAVLMCRIAYEDGTRCIAATAHLGPDWPRGTAALILEKTRELAARLDELGIPVSVFPSAEIAVQGDLEAAWTRGDLFGVGGRTEYCLLEIPYHRFVDLRRLVNRLQRHGVRPIVAHPERYPELLDEAGAVEDLIAGGALMQVTAAAISSPPDWSTAMTIRRWVESGMVHLVGSDGHSPVRRPPQMAEAYRELAVWVGSDQADRMCGLHGLAVLEGRPLRLPRPRRDRRRWFSFVSRGVL